MATLFNILAVLVMIAVVVVLLRGLINMMRGGSGNTQPGVAGGIHPDHVDQVLEREALVAELLGGVADVLEGPQLAAVLVGRAARRCDASHERAGAVNAERLVALHHAPPPAPLASVNSPRPALAKRDSRPLSAISRVMAA